MQIFFVVFFVLFFLSSIPVSHLSADEGEDVHLPGLAVLDGGDDEAGAAQDDLPPGPAVDRELELPFTHVVRSR